MRYVLAPAVYANLSLLEMEAGDWAAVLAATQGTSVVRGVQSRLLTALIEGRVEEGRAYIRAQLTDPALQPVFSAQHLPAMAAALGDPGLPLDLFEDVGGWNAVVWTDIFSEVRRQPRFKELAERFGYVDYWRSTGNWADKYRPVNDDFECF